MGSLIEGSKRGGLESPYTIHYKISFEGLSVDGDEFQEFRELVTIVKGPGVFSGVGFAEHSAHVFDGRAKGVFAAVFVDVGETVRVVANAGAAGLIA